MSDAPLAIARNAVALLDEAEFLFLHERYPRAAALAVLAAEEAGKFWLHDIKPKGWRRMLDRHSDKIGVGARFHERGRTAGGTVLKSTVGMVETFAGASSQPEYEQWYERAQGFLPLKEAGVYVDLDDDGNLASEPFIAVGKDTAAECLAYARSEVQRLYAAEIVQQALPLTPPRGRA